MMLDKLIIKYKKPACFSDPYQRYAEATKDAILKKAGFSIDIEDFKIIFGGSMPAGVYEESVFFLPDALRYISSHYWENAIHYWENAMSEYDSFGELLELFFRWIVWHYDYMKNDDIWDLLCHYLYELFYLATSRFELIDNGVPAGLAYLKSFFTYLGNSPSLAEDHMRLEFPYDITESFLEKRFTRMDDTFAGMAWLILLYNGYLGVGNIYGVAGIKESRFLENMTKESSWQSEIIINIISETEKRPETTEYWSNVLDYGMLF